MKGALNLGKYLVLLRNTRKAVEAAGVCVDQGVQVPLPLG